MDGLINDLNNSLQTGFVDQLAQSGTAYRPNLLINDKKNGITVLDSIDHHLRNCEEFWFSTAFVTTSGLAVLADTFKHLEEKGIPGKVLVSQYLNFTQPEALKKLHSLKNIELRIATEGSLHSKGYFFKQNFIYDFIIGSSNLTASALLTNREWNLKVSATEQSELKVIATNEFLKEFDHATPVTKDYIVKYDLLYRARKKFNLEIERSRQSAEKLEIFPNEMQLEALQNIQLLRKQGKNKALLISATGTGKTYLSAFDVQQFKPKRFLFIVHRLTIALDALRTFQQLLGDSVKMGVYTGNEKNADADYIFSTIHTISKEDHLSKFASDHFDYIVIDETHRAGAESYQRILNHFSPRFLLGMTATPERTDGADIFKEFDYNIAYEIRLHQALEQEMLSPFHYYGVTDLTINDVIIDKKSSFNQLVSEERIKHILDTINYYGCDDGIVRGLVFCSKKEECIELAKQFNDRGYFSVALTGDSKEPERERAIRLLESESRSEKLDYIFTVDIFNEGIDIPSVNQIIMLRPTESAIVFVQQLGRGLRKTTEKEYLTVIDFIGNYDKNYLIATALYGDTSYNKDSLRRVMNSGSNSIPGTCTINFDHITKERIFAAIDSANMTLKKDLVDDYKLLKYKIGRIPRMMDFIEHGSRDPYLYVEYSKSFYQFAAGIEDELKGKLNGDETKLIGLFSSEINNSKRIEETILLECLITMKSVSLETVKNIIQAEYGYEPSLEAIVSSVQNLNFDFVRNHHEIVHLQNGVFKKGAELIQLLGNKLFIDFLTDTINVAKYTFKKNFVDQVFTNGFTLYRKYGRKDVCRILNWDINQESTMYGYVIKNNFAPLFVTYDKHENIASSTKYDDKFINKSIFQWITKNNRTLESKEVLRLMNDTELTILLFVKKHDAEGNDFYFLGEVTPINDSFKQIEVTNDKGIQLPAVQFHYRMKHNMENALYEYITGSTV